ncbi:MAG: hypothetical protein ACI8ZN_002194, partial [Bacteroidia bacterium]
KSALHLVLPRRSLASLDQNLPFARFTWHLKESWAAYFCRRLFLSFLP